VTNCALANSDVRGPSRVSARVANDSQLLEQFLAFPEEDPEQGEYQSRSLRDGQRRAKSGAEVPHKMIPFSTVDPFPLRKRRLQVGFKLLLVFYTAGGRRVKPPIEEVLRDFVKFPAEG